MAGIRFSGYRDLRRILKTCEGHCRDLTAVHRKVAKMARDEERAQAPVRTGRMRSSVRHRATQRKASVIGGVGIAYFGKQEFRPHGEGDYHPDGTWYYPTYERRKAEWGDAAFEELGRMLDRTFGS